MATKTIDQIARSLTVLDGSERIPGRDGSGDFKTTVDYLRGYTGLYQNALINGNFDIWNRGTSFAYSVDYSADRWGKHNFQEGVRTRQLLSISGVHDGGSKYVLRCAGDGTNTIRCSTGQGIESSNTISLRGKTVTLSCLIKFSAATWSQNTGGFVIKVGYTTASADGSFSATDYLTTSSSSAVIPHGSQPTVFTKYTATIAIPTNATNIGVTMQATNSAIYAAADYYELSQVQLNVGSGAQNYQARGIADEKKLCDRYCKIKSITGIALSTANLILTVQYSTMRTDPTPTLYSDTDLGGTVNQLSRTFVGAVAVNITSSDFSKTGAVYLVDSAAPFVAGAYYTGSVLLDAEL